jgi:AcrR family transcriptional regulator
VPKVSEAHLAARRAQILAAARRLFAEHGYDGATVARLEAATGLSRGAIFNYFPDKKAIFVELAVETNRRFIALLLDRGLDESIRAMANENPEWVAALIEIESRMRHDEDFVRRLEEAHAPDSGRVFDWFREQQEAGVLRDDVDLHELGRFATMVINGMALRVASGDPFDVEAVLRLLNDAFAPRQ